ncbi:C45 family autoproteolytic acyltransferase/hydrolase [Candidatus Omnitrophota bacterium]
MKNQKIILFLIILLLVNICGTGWSASDNPELKERASFEGGKLYTAGKMNILVLKGTYKQMGRQYGKLLETQLNDFYETAIEGYFVKKGDIPYEEMKGLANFNVSRYPERFRDILQGIAETSGMDLDKIMILDQLIDIQTLNKDNTKCAAIVAWGDYTGEKPLVFGRNFDYPEAYKKFADFLMVTVYNPTDGSNPVAAVGYPAQIDLLTGMNNKGLFLELNDGDSSGGAIFYPDRLNIPIENLAWLLDSSTMTQLHTAIISTRTDYPVIINVSDASSAYSYECATFDTKQRSPMQKGLLVATNYFVDPSWGIADPPDGSWKTITRRKNLLALGKKYKGKIDPGVMKEILGTTIAQGGGTFPDRTIYQVVAMPKDLTIWVKAVGGQDWVKIDLRSLFSE